MTIIFGKFGYRIRNERGEKQAIFSFELKMLLITHSFFTARDENKTNPSPLLKC